MERIYNEISSLNAKLDLVLKRQNELAKISAENNVLLRRNMGLFEITQTLFPIDSKKNLKKLEKELSTDKRIDVVSIQKKKQRIKLNKKSLIDLCCSYVFSCVLHLRIYIWFVLNIFEE